MVGTNGHKCKTMAPTHETTRDLIRNAQGRVFTFNEAIDFMKLLDTMPTGTGSSLQWVDAKTKKPVAIGYNS